jgi:hypothetical protein
MTVMEAELSRGTIRVEIDRSSVAPDEMFGFAERINPKRSFLFVSKVLGRHIPVRPSIAQASLDRLAAGVDPKLPGPVLVIGMAETAIGLAAGVHEAYRKLSGRDDVVFICSTRHDLGTEKLCTFSEDHSHATQHLVHMPLDERIKEQLLGARSLVLVDDEASTGKTFANLFAALPEIITGKIEKTVLVTLTDWSDGAAEAMIQSDVESVSILAGRYQWQQGDHLSPLPAVPSIAAAQRTEFTPVIDSDWGRTGKIDAGEDLSKPDARTMTGRVIVLGTGEYVWQPFKLARTLADDGHDIHYASLTRSPISVGHVINDKEMFPDNYGLGVANYCYNIGSNSFDTAVLCVETPLDYISQTLLDKLKSACTNVILHSTVDGIATLENEKAAA